VGEERRVAWAALALSLLLAARAAPWRPSRERPAAEAPERGAARLLWGLPLDVNHEDVRDLEALPGIGPGRARAIVAARPHCVLDDLDRVPGIGPATLRRLVGRVTVGASPLCRRAKGD
jgi:predicted flap endonuclease-1-like 5' DNA nuclease